jgi:hypothetical protein
MLRGGMEQHGRSRLVRLGLEGFQLGWRRRVERLPKLRIHPHHSTEPSSLILPRRFLDPVRDLSQHGGEHQEGAFHAQVAEHLELAGVPGRGMGEETALDFRCESALGCGESGLGEGGGG